jgi:hypothetical protein
MQDQLDKENSYTENLVTEEKKDNMPELEKTKQEVLAFIAKNIINCIKLNKNFMEKSIENCKEKLKEQKIYE